jgi:hypothetical protein
MTTIIADYSSLDSVINDERVICGMYVDMAWDDLSARIRRSVCWEYRLSW